MMRKLVWGVATAVVMMGGMATAQAATFNSSNFSINGTLGDSMAGRQTSTNYQMVSRGGQSIDGASQSASYKLGQGYVAATGNSIEVRTQLNGLFGYYSFDQGAGTSAIDDSGNSNSASFTGSPSWTTGKLNGALGGFSASDYATSNNDTIYNASALTVCSWVNLTGSSTNPVAVGRAKGIPDANGMWSIGFNTGLTPRVRMYLNGTNYLVPGTPVTTGAWNHMCFSYGGTDLIFYVNGVEQNRTTVNAAMSSYSYPLAFGGVGNGSQPFNGKVDEVKLYNRVLSPKELKAEYTAQNSGISTGLTFGNDITTGQSATALFDSIVKTDASGYTLAINQNNNLTNGGATIPAVSGSIASPVTWNEGTTKGLGFTLLGATGTAPAGSWSNGDAYAALPGSATSFYTRSGSTGGGKDVINMRLKLDVEASQAMGEYTNQMTVTGTTVP